MRESTDTRATDFLPAALALKHVRQHALEYDFSVARAAGALGVSLPTLHRWFKTFATCTPAEMIEERRVTHALNLLQNARIDISEAARASGFSEPRQLRRAIKRRLGADPRRAWKDPSDSGGKRSGTKDGHPRARPPTTRR